jgi:hypothetical protein
MRANLIAHWTMNDTNGTTITDSKGNSAVANSSLTSVPGATSNTGTAMSFNGSQSSVTNGNLGVSGASARTFAWWAKNANPSSNYCMLGMGPYVNGYRDLAFCIVSNGYYVFSNGSYDFLYAVNIGTAWHHYTATFNGTTMVIYLDGTSLGQHAVPLNTDNAPFSIGSNGTGGWWSPPHVADAMTGSLDDIRVYNRVLTQTEITSLAAGTEVE